MTDTDARTIWDPTVSAVLLCPIFVILLTPLTIGIGLNVFDGLGEVPFALALCTPFAFALLRLFSPRSVARHLAAFLRPQLHQSGKLSYAPARQILMPRAAR